MTISIQQSLCIPDELHGQRIDSAIAALLPEYSRSQLTQWIKAGHITRNQEPCKPKDKALQGDILQIDVTLTLPDPDFKTSLPEEIPLDIIFEDESILIINKPAGLIVHPGAGNSQHTLVNALLHHAPTQAHLPRAGIIHRLDKDTTGLLVIAKTLKAHTLLIRQMQERSIQRQYLALVQGYVIGSSTLETGFGRHGLNRHKMAVKEQGKTAITHYQIHKHYQDFTLLDIHLMTGRTHQIRVHMQYIHHPVAGDPLYGKLPKLHPETSDALKNYLKQFKRQALHAIKLTLAHPETDAIMTFEAPIPADFAQLLTLLDENSE